MKSGLAVIILLSFVNIAFAIPNFKDYPAGAQRRQAFFNYMRPLVKKVNHNISTERNKLLILYDKLFKQNKSLSDNDIAWVKKLFSRYRITMSDKKSQWQALINRVDIVPTSLAMAQAANETAYGISRFAQQANNMFGVWCFSRGCGLVPRRRDKNKHHQVRKYPSVTASIQAYMHNLNSNYRYALFRKLRAQERSYGKVPSGVILAAGLLPYSQLRETYVEALQKIIINNKLEKTIDYHFSS